MTLAKIQFKPGVYKDDSPLEAKGYWVDADKVRFVRGLPETIYGWERASTTALLGYCRGAFTYADNSRNPYAAFGTNLRLYGMDVDGNVTDLTPVSTRTNGVGVLFSTTVGTTSLVAAYTHGLSTDQKLTFENSSVTTVGGVMINGSYGAGTVSSAYSLTLTALQTATTTTGATPATVYLTTYLAPGQADGIGGFGFGTGGYGSGGYQSATSGLTLFPRTWSLSQWGQNLIANPRGGGIYEWAPNTGATELVTNGSFTGSATGWTLGAGWAYGANNLAATNASTLAQQSITTPPGAWCVVSVDMAGWSTGGLQLSYAGTNVGTSQVANTTYRAVFFTGAGGSHTLALSGTNLTASLDNVSTAALASANVITGAPTQVACCFVTSERSLVACGCLNANGNYDALQIRWTGLGNNQDWPATNLVPSGTSLSGGYTLSNGSLIVRGLSGSLQNLIWTDTALYGMRYNPDPTAVYSFVEIGAGCGLIGPNAVSMAAGIAYWLTPGGQFFRFDGSAPTSLNCTLRRDVMDNLAFVQQDKVYAFSNNARNEVWFLYPDSRDGIECSRYIIYNYIENHWSCGTFDRTAWTDAGIFQFALAVDSLGNIWFQEKGFSADGGSRSWLVSSSYLDQGDGDTHTRLLGIVPDQEDLQGNYTFQVDARIHNNAGILNRTFGPYGVTAMTGNLNFRANGQEMKYTWAGTSSPAFWRYGATRFDLQQTGRTK